MNTSKAISRFQGRVIHLTHTDLDAVCSDAIMRRKHGEILTIYSSVQQFQGHIDQLVVSCRRPLALYLSDLGGHPSAVEILAKLKTKGWRVEWRDHHVWDEQTVRHAQGVVDYLRVDPQFCACEIVFQDILPDDPIAHEIAAVGRDRDFWINKDPRSEMLATVVHDDPWRKRVAEDLSTGIFLDQDIEREYEKQTKTKDASIERAIQRSRAINHIAVTIGNRYASDIAALLRKKYGTRIEIVLRTNGVFSIRSTDPISNRIAERFGGGGHPHAAGGNLHFSMADRFLFRLRTFRHKKVQELLRAALAYEEAHTLYDDHAAASD
ncbi:MAG: phosphoesterase [Halobacteriota archaeon]